MIFPAKIQHCWKKRFWPIFWHENEMRHFSIIFKHCAKSTGKSSRTRDSELSHIFFWCLIWKDFFLAFTKQYVNTYIGHHRRTITWQLLQRWRRSRILLEQQLLWTNIIIREQGQATDKARQSRITISRFVKIYFYGEKIRKWWRFF